MGMATVRRLAARIKGVGERRVRISPDEQKRAAEALTADDVRSLIREKVVWIVPVKGVPRTRARARQARRKKGRGTGSGSRKGARFAKVSRKRQWENKVRAQRGLLRDLRAKKVLGDEHYRNVYRMIKGNAFRSRKAMLTHLQEQKWVKEK